MEEGETEGQREREIATKSRKCKHAVFQSIVRGLKRFDSRTCTLIHSSAHRCVWLWLSRVDIDISEFPSYFRDLHSVKSDRNWINFFFRVAINANNFFCSVLTLRLKRKHLYWFLSDLCQNPSIRWHFASRHLLFANGIHIWDFGEKEKNVRLERASGICDAHTEQDVSCFTFQFSKDT